MKLQKCILINNDCYKKTEKGELKKITPKGIVVHSTGANNPNLRRYVGPDDGILGKNLFNNHWNRSGVGKCVHGFIGKDKNGEVQVYQTLPFNYACWGVGNGKKGSYNYNPAYIQFEICEDNLKDATYFNRAFETAIEFCAYLCEKYNISVENVVSHHEAHVRGYGSDHEDCDHWLKKHGKNMDWFRDEVAKKLNVPTEQKNTTTYTVKKGDTLSKIASTYNTTVNKLVSLNNLKNADSIKVGQVLLIPTNTAIGKCVNYKVKINTKELNVRALPDATSTITTTVKKGEVFTIVRESNGWGKLKSGAGWISLNYTKKKK